MRLKGEGAKERMRAIEESAYYEIAELYIEGVEGGLFAVNYAEELEDGEHYVVKMRPTMKTLVEDEISEVEETALPKKTKTRLRRVEGQERRVEGEQGGTFAVDVAEVYSPPRIASAAEKAGLNAGGSYDIQTGYDLGTPQGLEAMWNGLVEHLGFLEKDFITWTWQQRWLYGSTTGARSFSSNIRLDLRRGQKRAWSTSCNYQEFLSAAQTCAGMV